MPFNQNTFFGASIRGVNSSLGWNSQSSSLSVNLVEDVQNLDSFNPVSIGQPVYFQLGSYQFYGTLKKWTKNNDVDGLPSYTVEASDVRSLLEKVQLIIGAYNGSTGGIPNLLNIYGYYESAGFGQSSINDSGMPWLLIKNAVTALTNLPAYNTYGGPITYKGYTYSLDLSELPNLPSYFRVFGPTLSLMDFIQQICDYGGCDFFIKMVGLQIQVKVASRLTQPPLGTIASIASSLDGQTVIKSSYGLEERDEVTTAFLIGGEVHTLYKSTSIETYWGQDVLYNPIIGYNKYWHFYNDRGRYLGSMLMHMANLNASPVADVLGSTFYPCSMAEMRASLMSMDSWIDFVKKFNPVVANMFDLPGFGLPPAIRGDAVTPADRLGARRAEIMQLNRIAVSADQRTGDKHGSYSKAKRLYDFVKHYAQNYMGKKYACRVPFVLAKTETDTSQVLFSYEPTDAGYIESSGENDLDGLPSQFSDIFQVQDGRYNSFVYYSDVQIADLGQINKSSTLLNGYKLYAKCAVDSKIIFIPEPAVVVTVDPVYQLPQNDATSYTVNGLIDQARGVVQNNNAVPPADSVTIDGMVFPRSIECFFNGTNLYSGYNSSVILKYNDGTSSWSGSVIVRGGTVLLTYLARFTGSPATESTTTEGFWSTLTHNFNGLNNLLLSFTATLIETGLVIDNENIYPDSSRVQPSINPLRFVYNLEYRDLDGWMSYATISFNDLNSETNGVRATSGGNIAPSLNPPPIPITHAHIPLKSNILTYGPWYAGTTPGKVHVEQDGSLVPWNYGGYSGLDLAANARVASQITNMTVSETGTLELVGLPNFSLGDLMQTGGPNITRINIGYSERGVTTSFSFETFVPRFGQMGKYVSDRIRRNSLITQNFLRESKLNYRKGLLASESFNRATAGAIGNYIQNLPTYLRRQTPHTVFFGRNILDRNIVRPLFSTATLQEALAGCNADQNSIFLQSSIVGLDALVRPISVFGTGQFMATMSMPTGIWITGLNSSTLNPLRLNADGHDFEIIMYNTSGVYEGVHHYRENIGAKTNPRNFVALRGPIIITGHGYDIYGQYQPTQNTYTRSDNWKTGPLDPLWDEDRQTWTVHDVLKGKTTSLVTAANSGAIGFGTMDVWMNNQNTRRNMTIYNWFGTSIASGVKVIANYVVTDGGWFVTSADC